MRKKTVLITGGGKNIGLEIAKVFAQKGYQIAITGRDFAQITEAAQKLANAYPQAAVSGYALELSDLGSIKSLMEALEKDMPQIDVLVCNAGHLGISLDIHNTTEADFDAVFDTNVKGNFFLIQAAAKNMMAAERGCVVLINSVQGKGAVAGRTVYGATKGALAVLNKYLACDLAPYHIRVNAVTLGAVHTDRWDSMPADVAQARRSAYPLGRESTGEEIGRTVLFLAEDAESMTGAEICVDSGLTAALTRYSNKKN